MLGIPNFNAENGIKEALEHVQCFFYNSLPGETKHNIFGSHVKYGVSQEIVCSIFTFIFIMSMQNWLRAIQ